MTEDKDGMNPMQARIEVMFTIPEGCEHNDQITVETTPPAAVRWDILGVLKHIGAGAIHGNFHMSFSIEDGFTVHEMPSSVGDLVRGRLVAQFAPTFTGMVQHLSDLYGRFPTSDQITAAAKRLVESAFAPRVFSMSDDSVPLSRPGQIRVLGECPTCYSAGRALHVGNFMEQLFGTLDAVVSHLNVLDGNIMADLGHDDETIVLRVGLRDHGEMFGAFINGELAAHMRTAIGDIEQQIALQSWIAARRAAAAMATAWGFTDADLPGDPE